MYLEVYPDIVFILNFFVDIILLFLLKLVNRKKTKIIRLLGAAGLGGVAAAVLSVFPWIISKNNLGYVTIFLGCLEVIIKLSTLLLMILITFGSLKWKDYIRQIIIFVLITYFAGGFIISVYYHTNIRLTLISISNSFIISSISAKYVIILMLVLLPITALLILLQRIYKYNQREVYEVDLYYKNNKYVTIGFYDTGNCLYDPICRKPVIVIEQSILPFLLPEDELKALSTILNCSNQSLVPEELKPRLRLIPYSSIGKSQGILPGLLIDKILIHMGKETICCDKVIAALSDQMLSPKGEYHVILHKELM